MIASVIVAVVDSSMTMIRPHGNTTTTATILITIRRTRRTLSILPSTPTVKVLSR
jgi:hypothetical protein